MDRVAGYTGTFITDYSIIRQRGRIFHRRSVLAHQSVSADFVLVLFMPGESQVPNIYRELVSSLPFPTPHLRRTGEISPRHTAGIPTARVPTVFL